MQVERLLSIMLIIANKGLVTGQELADHFEVSLRTIYRDIDKVCAAGVPIASNGGKGGGYYIMENYNLNKLFFNKGEMQTFLTVMNSLRFMFGKNQQFNDIVLKFETLEKERTAQDKLSINMSHFSMEEELKQYLFLMNKAIEENRQLVFDYINRNMDYAQRTAEPIQITFSSGQWYLTAFCRTRNDLRRFKLVRINNLTLGDFFIKREYTKDQIQNIINEGYERNSIKVSLKFTKKIGPQLPEYFCRESIQPSQGDCILVEEFFPNEEGLIKYVLSFGKECEVIQPPCLRKRVMDYIEELARVYKD